MTLCPFCSLNLTHRRSISPQSELPTVPTASASGNSPMFCGLRSASAMRFSKLSSIRKLESWNDEVLEWWTDGRVVLLQHSAVFSFSSLGLVTSYFRVHFLGPGVNASAQAADILKAVAHKIGGGVEGLPALMVHHHERPRVNPFGHDLAHDGLGKQHRAFNVNGFKFLTRADIYQPHGAIPLEPVGKLFRDDKDSFIFLMAGFDVIEHFDRITPAVTLAYLFEGFIRLKRATAAPADMVAPEQSALRSREGFQDFTHG